MICRAEVKGYATEAIVSVGKLALRLRANARTPQSYRAHTGRDIFSDVEKLREKYKRILNMEINETGELVRFDSSELTIFADIFYILHITAQPDARLTCAADLLDKIPGEFPIMVLLPVVLRIWKSNCATLNEATEQGPETMREFSTALYLLRAYQLGLSALDLDELTVGMVTDMMAEKSDDSVQFNLKATPELMQKLFGG